ncbi:MAG: hypothetical protein D6696_08810 [Acidobacteria bacterium]|nr:MAG: hypothetical protein D6696_08810 [Acidobacteriota bacterium]
MKAWIKKRPLLIVSSTLLALAVTGSFAASSAAAPGGVAGSYLVDLTPSVQPPFQGLMTIGNEGTLVLTNTSQFGAPDPATLGLNSTAHGSFRHAGGRRIDATLLFFDLEPDGDLELVVRIRGSWSFDPGFQKFSGPFSGAAFLPGQDPLDPDEVPVFTFGGTLSARRIPA